MREIWGDYKEQEMGERERETERIVNWNESFYSICTCCLFCYDGSAVTFLSKHHSIIIMLQSGMRKNIWRRFSLERRQSRMWILR